MNIETLFFQLLQVSIGTRKNLSITPTAKEWRELFEMSKKQALVAVAFAGVNKLKANGCLNAGIDEMTYLQWLGLTAKVAQRNKEVSEACVELVRQYAHDGIATCILKGQGNLEYYPEELKECRTPGDIDVWCSPADPSGIEIAVSDLDGKGAHYAKYHGKQAVIEYVKMLHRIAGTEPTEGVRYHHIYAPSINGVEVEAHFRPLFLDSPLRNWRLQRWFRENEQFGVCDFAVGIKTKTGKTPEGIVSNEVSEIDPSTCAQEPVGELAEPSSSVSLLSTDSLAASYMPSGNKPKKKHSLNETDGVSKAKCFCPSTGSGQAEGAGFVPDGGATPDRGCDGNVGLKMRACSKSQTVIGSTKSEASTTGRGFSGFCQNRIPIPTVSFNAIYQLCHIYRHLFDEGIGLRQLLDYYFVLRALHIEQGSLADSTQSMAQWAEGMGIGVKSNEEIMHTLGRFGMKKFAGAVMYVLQTVFAMPDEYLICKPNEKEGRFLLNEIMQAGNFGKYDTRISHSTSQMGHAWEKLKHNFRLIRHYPEEVMWEPWFRVYHWVWRKLELWKF